MLSKSNVKKTVLVAGGAGFIGSNLTKMLNHSGYDTIVLDNLSRGRREAVLTGSFIEGNIGDEDILNRLFSNQKIDAVIHLAALINVGESVQNPLIYYQNNVCETLVLLNSMIRHEVKSFIFSSSAAVYGVPKEMFLKETDPCEPINPYGESKWMIEKILKDFDNAYGLKYCALRYFNAAGGDPQRKIKNYQTKHLNLIPILLSLIKDPERIITINGDDYPTVDGTCVRDYIHIEDLGEAHILAMEKLFTSRHSSIYNLGNGKGYSILEVIQAVEEITGKQVKYQIGPRRAGDPPILIADASKAMKELPWTPKYSRLHIIIEDAWNALNH